MERFQWGHGRIDAIIQLVLTTLNISKSAYVCFTFAANRFFSRYNFEGNAQYLDKFYCQLYIRVCYDPALTQKSS